MTPVRLDNLTAITVPDCCKKNQHNYSVIARVLQTTSCMMCLYLRRLCECTVAEWRRLSTGSPAGTLASPPSHSAPSHFLEGKTGTQKDKTRSHQLISSRAGDQKHADGEGMLWDLVPLWRGWQALWRWSSSKTTQTWRKRGGRRSGRQLEVGVGGRMDQWETNTNHRISVQTH